jgi:hypothetical protein
LRVYRSTSKPSYARRRETREEAAMAFAVRFSDDSVTVVRGADAYEHEGPLTTFFDRNGGGGLKSAFSVRIASFRTDRLVEVRRLEPGETVTGPATVADVA